MSVFQLPAQIRIVAQSCFCLVVTTSVVTASDLDVFSNFQEIGCLICKNQLPSGNFNHASHLNNEEPPEEKWDFLSRLFVPLKQITSSPCYWQFPLVKEMLLIYRGAKLRAC